MWDSDRPLKKPKTKTIKNNNKKQQKAVNFIYDSSTGTGTGMR